MADTVATTSSWCRATKQQLFLSCNKNSQSVKVWFQPSRFLISIAAGRSCGCISRMLKLGLFMAVPINSLVFFYIWVEKMFKKQVDHFVGFFIRGMLGAIGHGDPVLIAQ